MTSIGRARATRLVLLLSAVIMAGSVAFATSVAYGGPVEGVTGPVNESVAPITETVAPPVHEVTETVAPPVKEVTETVAKPVKEAAEAAKPPLKQAAETVATSPATAPVKAAAGTAVHTATTTTDSSSGGAGKDAGTVAHEATGTVTHIPAGTALAPGATTTGTDAGAASEVVAPHGSGGGKPAAAVDAGPGTDIFVVPSVDGSVRAPLGRLRAYVWPAVALTRAMLARGGLLARWEQAAVRLALSPSSGESASGSDGGPVREVAHASGGQVESSSGRSLFSKIPSALAGSFETRVPLPLMLYLLMVFAVVGVVAFMLWDGKVFDRRRRH
jgi:hypothetical protein